jgi:signal transduction histidine kinase
MSHELRTPLNSIIGFSRVILKGIDGPITDVQQQDLTAIYNAGQHLLGLINDVLDLSKIEAGKMVLAFEDQVNLVELCQGVLTTIAGLLKDKPVQLESHFAPHLPKVRADPLKIRQILLNLLSNAAKFTEEGSIRLEAETQTDPQGQAEVILRVIDTGPGIAPKDQGKLFQAFSQVESSQSRKPGGTGLGLSICHHLVEMHGGRIGLISDVGKGSTFYFTLPLPVLHDGESQL